MSVELPGARVRRRATAPLAWLATPAEGSVIQVTVRSLVLVVVAVLLVVVVLPAVLGAAAHGTAGAI